MKTDQNQALSPAEQISLIRDVLKLNMSDLAMLLKVTRPTTYRWLEGIEPNPEAQKHIGYLASVAEQAAYLDISRLDLLIHRPLFEGYSLLDQLKENKNVDESLQTIKVIADKELTNRQKIKSSGKSRVSLSEAMSDNSTPIHHG